MILCTNSLVSPSRIEYLSSSYIFTPKSNPNLFTPIDYPLLTTSNQTLSQSKIINNNINIVITRRRFTMADSHPRVSAENGSIDSNCTEIIIVRHGETDWNDIGKMQGQLDVELNEIGRQQAVAVADRLSREPNIAAIYSSDLKRALETAQTIASRCGLEVITDQDLRERHLGDMQGRLYQDIAKLNPKAYEAFKSHRSDQEIPGGGESRDQLFERSTAVLRKIGEKHRGQRVIVVSHGGAIRTMYNRAAGKGQHPGKILNTSVGVIQLFDGDMWAIKSWNDVSHLKQTEFLESAFGGDASSG